MEVIVNVPDGKYCKDCKFLNYYTHDMVNMFGDPTGHVERGYECKYHGTKLEVEDHGCYNDVKKCFSCGGRTEEKTLLLLLAMMTFGGDKLKKELEKHGGERQEADG